MTTLSARANQAYHKLVDEAGENWTGFSHQRDAFEEGWETGYKTRDAEMVEAIMKHYHSEFCEYDGTEGETPVCAGECREFAEAIGGLS